MAAFAGKIDRDSKAAHVIKGVLRVMVQDAAQDAAQDAVHDAVADTQPDSAAGSALREYANVVIRMRDFDGQRIAVEVTESPVGRMGAPDYVSFDQSIIAQLNRLADSGEGHKPAAFNLHELRELGEALASVLFPHNVREVFRKSELWVRRRIDALGNGQTLPGLRLVLSIDDARLVTLPWEYVYLQDRAWLGERLDEQPQLRSDVKEEIASVSTCSSHALENHGATQMKPIVWEHDQYVVVSRLLSGPSSASVRRLQEAVQHDRFLARDPAVSIVRSEPLVVDPNQTLEPFDSRASRRLFLGTANRADLVQALEGIEGIAVTGDANNQGEPGNKAEPGWTAVTTPHLNIQTLEEWSKSQFDVFHYIDAGGVRDRTAEETVDAADFAQAVRRMNAKVVVLMNCCGHERTVSHWSGVATALLRVGVPVVIGVQHALTLDAARKFSTAFYQSLAGGESIDQAVSAGRKELAATDPDGAAFGGPVIYTRH